MPMLEYAGKKVEIDDEGYLVNMDDWDENVACALAEREGVEELTNDRLEVLKFSRDYYKKFNFFPIMRGICKNIHQPKDCVSEQFASPLQAWKLAGLQKPDELVVNVLEYGQTPT